MLALYSRQHPRQHTRTHGRLSLESLRRIKAAFFALGPAQGGAQVQVWSIGVTLEGWVAALREAGAVDVVGVEWKPGAPLPEAWRSWAKRKAVGADGASVSAARKGVVRLFAYGKERAREKVRAGVRDWDEHLDWFAA